MERLPYFFKYVQVLLTVLIWSNMLIYDSLVKKSMNGSNKGKEYINMHTILYDFCFINLKFEVRSLENYLILQSL